MVETNLRCSYLYGVLLIILHLHSSNSVGMPGGLGETKPADAKVGLLLDQAMGNNEKLLKEFGELKAISYKTQVVAGTNYFIKAKPSNLDEYVHFRIFQPLPYLSERPTITAYQRCKTEEEEIVYFGKTNVTVCTS